MTGAAAAVTGAAVAGTSPAGSMHRPLSRVVVTGRDADLWLCVSAISRALGPAGVSVVAIELPSRLQPSHISATLPPLEALHAKLGIKESALIRPDWSRGTGAAVAVTSPAGSGDVPSGESTALGRRPSFFHAWGACGAPVDGSAFFPCWLKAMRHGFNIPLQSFSLTAVAAQNGRMLLPDETTAAFGRTDYGYHMPTMAYVGYLKSSSATRGVTIYEARHVTVERDPNGGSVTALTLDGSLRVEGQLFVDATGEDAVLIGQSLGVTREHWGNHFIVNRVLSALAPAFTSIPPFAEIRTARVGWTALHPSQVATGVLHAYSSGLLSDEAALESATAASGVKLTDVSFHPVNPYLRSRVWEGNCIAVGGSACALDPMHDVDLHALQLGIVHLLSLFPVTEQFGAERAEYNRVMRSYYERVRDFQCAFYAVSALDGEFWQQAHRRSVPQPVAHKIATFRARAAIAPMEDETFFPESWQAIFTGLGVMPESWAPAVDRILPDRFTAEFRRILQFIKRKVLEQPTHSAYLDSICRSATV
jgi:tryptophan halogenase